MGFRNPTPVQRKALPVVLSGSDTVVMARTGSGKTCAFLIPLLETLFANPDVVVISADVNEIVAQENGVLTQFTAAMLATKIIASHALTRQEGRWIRAKKTTELPFNATFFAEFGGD